MYSQVEKTKENKSRAVANSIDQNKDGVKQRVAIKDNRKKATVGLIDDAQNKPLQKADAVAGIVNEENDAVVRGDIVAAMEKIKARLKKWATEDVRVENTLKKKTGRDAWVYAGFRGRKRTLGEHLDRWDESWGINKTCGLLLDLGNALRSLCPKMEIMNDEMKASRAKGHSVNRDSEWAQESVPKGSKLKSGVSATTGNLLRTLEYLNVTTPLELEAIIIGAVKYWDKGSFIKKIRGEYHTAAEAWSVYNYYLIKKIEDKIAALKKQIEEIEEDGIDEYNVEYYEMAKMELESLYGIERTDEI